jgi:hypothetical protein
MPKLVAEVKASHFHRTGADSSFVIHKVSLFFNLRASTFSSKYLKYVTLTFTLRVHALAFTDEDGVDPGRRQVLELPRFEERANHQPWPSRHP